MFSGRAAASYAQGEQSHKSEGGKTISKAFRILEAHNRVITLEERHEADCFNFNFNSPVYVVAIHLYPLVDLIWNSLFSTGLSHKV